MDWLIDEPVDGVFSLFSRKFDDFPDFPELVDMIDDQTPDFSDLEKYLASPKNEEDNSQKSLDELLFDELDKFLTETQLKLDAAPYAPETEDISRPASPDFLSYHDQLVDLIAGECVAFLREKDILIVDLKRTNPIKELNPACLTKIADFLNGLDFKSELKHEKLLNYITSPQTPSPHMDYLVYAATAQALKDNSTSYITKSCEGCASVPGGEHSLCLIPQETQFRDHIGSMLLDTSNLQIALFVLVELLASPFIDSLLDNDQFSWKMLSKDVDFDV